MVVCIYYFIYYTLNIVVLLKSTVRSTYKVHNIYCFMLDRQFFYNVNINQYVERIKVCHAKHELSDVIQSAQDFFSGFCKYLVYTGGCVSSYLIVQLIFCSMQDFS